jgi:putative FmdB family regulatory protein
MPTYEYLCPEGHLFDVFQKMSEKPRAKCPRCGRIAVRQISGGAGLVFKGSGFYITDYGKDGKGPRKESPASAGESSSAADKPSAEKSGGDAPAAAPAPEKPAEKSTKPKSSSKKAKE